MLANKARFGVFCTALLALTFPSLTIAGRAEAEKNVDVVAGGAGAGAGEARSPKTDAADSESRAPKAGAAGSDSEANPLKGGADSSDKSAHLDSTKLLDRETEAIAASRHARPSLKDSTAPVDVKTLKKAYPEPDLSKNDVIAILQQEFRHLSVLFDKTGTFTGKIEEGSKGTSTRFLYLIKNDADQLVLIIKGIKESVNPDEIDNLVRMNKHKRLSHMSSKPSMPILSWVEGIYKYQVKTTNRFKSYNGKWFAMTVINSARGEQLQSLFMTHRYNKKTLRDIFFSVGAAFASFNQYIAEATPHNTVEQVNEMMKFGHEDLHWKNIFVHRKPTTKTKAINPYRVYFIDNESILQNEADSWFLLADKTLDRIRGQIYFLYGWSLFAENIDCTLSKNDLMSMFYEGFIKGYASKFSDPASVEVYLIHCFLRINEIFLNRDKAPEDFPVMMRIERKLQEAMRHQAQGKSIDQLVALKEALLDFNAALITAAEAAASATPPAP